MDWAIVTNQIGLLCGFASAVSLWFSRTRGIISKNGNIIFNDLDPMENSEANRKIVESSHKRSRYLMPLGWVLLALSFLLQLISTFKINFY